MSKTITVSLDRLYKIKTDLIRGHIALSNHADEDVRRYGRLMFDLSQYLECLISNGEQTPTVTGLTYHDWFTLYASVILSELDAAQKEGLEAKMKAVIRSLILEEGND